MLALYILSNREPPIRSPLGIGWKAAVFYKINYVSRVSSVCNLLIKEFHSCIKLPDARAATMVLYFFFFYILFIYRVYTITNEEYQVGVIVLKYRMLENNKNGIMKKKKIEITLYKLR